MRDGKYVIKKIKTVDAWYCWELYTPDGMWNAFPSWQFAIYAMELDRMCKAARANRIALGPIGTVEQSDEIPRAGRSI